MCKVFQQLLFNLFDNLKGRSVCFVWLEALGCNCGLGFEDWVMALRCYARGV